MSANFNRRTFLAGVSAAAFARGASTSQGTRRLVLGLPKPAEVGHAVLDSGGNAVDAMVAAALVGGVFAVPLTGIGGYGGHLVIGGLPGGKVTAIDFNTTAPAALTPDYYRADEAGRVKGNVNGYGWLSVGVPGVLAGLQLALDRYGTKKFSDLVQPAAKIARDGFSVSKNLATAVAGNKTRLLKDPGSAKLFFPNGEPIKEGVPLRNPDLARMLDALGQAGSVAPFYTGDIAARIAAAFKANGGLVTTADLAAYKAAEIAPLAFDWNGYMIHTPRPTAGGLTVLQTLATLKALGAAGKAGPAMVEALRAAWTDRLALIGDPAYVDVPTGRLLSEEYAKQTAERVAAAVRDRKPIQGRTDGLPSGGTLHLNAVDANGLTVALTYTHGGYLGAQITVDGLGLVLGHGMSRFDPRPGRPNSPGPGKRPLHNMCPTVVTKAGVPVLAVGAIGGRRIVNAVASVLAYRIGEGLPLDAAVKAPRVHTEGDLKLTADAGYPGTDALKAAGYKMTTGTVAALNAIERNPASNELRPMSR